MLIFHEVPKMAVTPRNSGKVQSGNHIKYPLSVISKRFPKCRLSHYIYRITDVLGTSSRALLSTIAHYCDIAALVSVFTHFLAAAESVRFSAHFIPWFRVAVEKEGFPHEPFFSVQSVQIRQIGRTCHLLP